MPSKFLAGQEATKSQLTSLVQVTTNLSGQVAAQFESINFGTRSFRQSTNFFYQDKIGGKLALHQIKSKIDDVNQDGLELRVNGSTGVSGLHTFGEIGFLSIADDKVYGNVSFSFTRKTIPLPWECSTSH